ncbi:MAG: glutathione S-transferase family protein [Alphaproteobacteria bacterium]
MTGQYRIFGSEMSPYSVKVRSYFRFKGIDHQWIARGPANEEEFKKFARLPIVPMVVTPDDQGIQDSTPIIEAVDPLFPEPAIHPANRALIFLSALLEEFGDEWGNKLMFHHRWFAPVDQQASALTLAYLSRPDGTPEQIEGMAGMILGRMSTRGHFVGSSPENAPLITGYYLELLDLLQAHLTTRKYLLGNRPSFGDFGLAAQLYEASVDPTCGAIMMGRAPDVLAWCHRMMEPRLDGEFETWNSLQPTLAPILAYVGRYFLPWTKANAKALEAGEDTFTIDLPGGAYVQPPQKYHARSLATLRTKYEAVKDDPDLAAILAATGCDLT